MRNNDILKVIIVLLLFMSVSALVGIRHWRDAQAGTAAKSAFLDAGGPVGAPSSPKGDPYALDTDVFIPIPQAEYLSFACGAGEIRISFNTGEAEFINCDPSDASKHLWTALKPFFNDCRR